MRILVLGGTGVISRAIISEGIKAGHEMIALNRGKREAQFQVLPEIIRADWSDENMYREKTRGLDVDVVIDMLSRTPEDAERTLACFGGKTHQWIFTSTCCAYKKPIQSFPIRESEAELWNDPIYTYPYEKARMEQFLFTRQPEDREPITVIRPSLTYGEGCSNIGILRQNINVFRRIQAGKPLLVFDEGKTIFTFTFAPDLARGYLACCLNPKAYGEAFHIVSRNQMDFASYYLCFGKIVGCEPTFVTIDSEALYNLDPVQFEHIWFEKRFDHIFSIDKIKSAAPEWEPEITLEDGLRHMLVWWEEQNIEPLKEKDELEDKLCALGKPLEG